MIVGLIICLVSFERALAVGVVKNLPEIYEYFDNKKPVSFKVRGVLKTKDLSQEISADYSTISGLTKIKSNLKTDKKVLNLVLLKKVEIVNLKNNFKSLKGASSYYEKKDNSFTVTIKEDVGTTTTKYFFQKKEWSRSKNVLTRVEQAKYEGRNIIKTKTLLSYEKSSSGQFVVRGLKVSISHGVGLDESNENGRKLTEDFTFTDYKFK